MKYAIHKLLGSGYVLMGHAPTFVRAMQLVEALGGDCRVEEVS